MTRPYTAAFRCPDGRIAVPLYAPPDSRAWLMVGPNGDTAVAFGDLPEQAQPLLTEDEWRGTAHTTASADHLATVGAAYLPEDRSVYPAVCQYCGEVMCSYSRALTHMRVVHPA